MRLSRARVQKYRSVDDSGWFSVENTKTILVGQNEAGKTAILAALQQLNPPEGVSGFEALRDYPRSQYSSDIQQGRVNPSEHTVVRGQFTLEDADRAVLPDDFTDCTYVVGYRLDNSRWHRLEGGPEVPIYGAIKKDLLRLRAHVDSRANKAAEEGAPAELPGEKLDSLTETWCNSTRIADDRANNLNDWLNEEALPLIDEDSSTQDKRYDQLIAATEVASRRDQTAKKLLDRLPILVFFNNYFRVRPSIHLGHLAQRVNTQLLDDEFYDYGNNCLLQLLGFSAEELSKLGNAQEPPPGDIAALKAYQDQLDSRSYQLNAASIRLSEEINKVWIPDSRKGDTARLHVRADAQYLKVVVEDDLGVEVELDQRSEGFQWLVSFFVVFFAEAADKYENAILLLDEPGLSLHGLRQRDFRKTVSRLAESNQTIYTTHSPFLVGPDELDLVRVVEMATRKEGTKVHTSATASDPEALLPLQEALGYDLAQSLFTQKRNLVLEGLTDYWYVAAVAALLRESGHAELDERISLVPAGSASKVVYFATILHAQNLKVAALLDSDSAGTQAAQQKELVHALGNKRILRTADVYEGPVPRPEIEDLLRETLLIVARSELGWNVATEARNQPERSIVELFEASISGFSKYRLAKAFLSWARGAKDLTKTELDQFVALIDRIGAALK